MFFRKRQVDARDANQTATSI